jgi:hypothetical protein
MHCPSALGVQKPSYWHIRERRQRPKSLGGVTTWLGGGGSLSNMNSEFSVSSSEASGLATLTFVNPGALA